MDFLDIPTIAVSPLFLAFDFVGVLFDLLVVVVDFVGISQKKESKFQQSLRPSLA